MGSESFIKKANIKHCWKLSGKICYYGRNKRSKSTDTSIGIVIQAILIDEHLTNDSLVIITENSDALIDEFPEGIVKWRFTKQDPASENEIKVASVEAYKGLEADMVIYIHSGSVSNNMNYIAHTRAKYYLIEFIRR